MISGRGDIADTESAISTVVRTQRPDRGGPINRGELLESRLRALGHSTGQIEALFGSFGLGVERVDDQLRLTTTDFNRLSEAVKLARDAFFESSAGQISAAQRFSQLLDLEARETGFQVASALTDALSGPLQDSVARIRDAFAGTGDFSASAVQDELQRIVESLGSEFDLSQIGDLSLDEFLRYIGQVESLGDQAEKAADALGAATEVLNAPRGFPGRVARVRRLRPERKAPPARRNDKHPVRR